MKRIVLMLAVTGILISGCNKVSKPGTSTGTYKGVILRNMCCQIVVQTTGGHYLGQNGWADASDAAHRVYDHVFKVGNPCQFGDHKAGDTINFHIVNPMVQNCACCMMFVSVPDSTYSIEVN